MSLTLAIIKLYGPFCVSLIIFLFFFRIKRSDQESNISISLFGLLDYQIPIKKAFLYKSLIIFSSLIPLTFYLGMDYSCFFPKNITMEVFYDKQGILDNLKQYSKTELEELNINIDFEKRDKFYFSDLDDHLQNLNLTDTFFTIKDAIIHSEGKASFVVEKISDCQNYFIKEANGELEHFLEHPRTRVRIVRSFFDKMNSRNDYLSPTLDDIFIKHSFIIRPLFKQIIAEDNKSDGTIFNHQLCGMTKIQFFPIPSFSNTIYLFECQGKLIPIGYAVYKD